MSIFKTLGAVFLSATALHTQAASVWKVTSSTNTLYIGGTIHLLTEQDYPLPKAYDIAFQNSDTIVFETDIDTVNSQAFQQNLTTEVALENGKTIDQLISKDTYTALKNYLQSRHISITTLQHIKPSALAMSLNMIELQHLGFTAQGVDQYYFEQASLAHKTTAWLETPKEQTSMIANIHDDDHDETILYALTDIENMADNMKKVRKIWREGDMKAMEEQELTRLKAEHPEVYQSLLVDRNERWVPKIEKMLTDESIEFVMVGALHLAGPDSVLQTLKNSGYTVQQM